jgi:hypothetical protein
VVGELQRNLVPIVINIVGIEIFMRGSYRTLRVLAGIIYRNCYCKYYVVRRIRGAVRRKNSEKYKTNSLFPLHDNAPAHRPGLMKDFLVNE